MSRVSSLYFSRAFSRFAKDLRISNFVNSTWNYKLQDPDSDASAWDWIVAMAKLDLQFEACLSLWLRQPTPNAFVQLANAATENALIRLSMRYLRSGVGLSIASSTKSRNPAFALSRCTTGMTMWGLSVIPVPKSLDAGDIVFG
jgi:hypothetical protein